MDARFFLLRGGWDEEVGVGRWLWWLDLILEGLGLELGFGLRGERGTETCLMGDGERKGRRGYLG